MKLENILLPVGILAVVAIAPSSSKSNSPKAEAAREAIALTPISYDQPKDLREKTHV